MAKLIPWQIAVKFHQHPDTKRLLADHGLKAPPSTRVEQMRRKAVKAMMKSKIVVRSRATIWRIVMATMTMLTGWPRGLEA
jgi:hypothetical protein